MGGRGSGGSRGGGGGASKVPEQEDKRLEMNETSNTLKNELLKKIESDYSSLKRSDFKETQNDDGSLDVDVRFLGRWESPEFEEDYDFDDLSSKSSKQIQKIVGDVQKKSGRKISWDAGEKNWINFNIK
jgi:C1A family cysteine protease